MRKFIAAATLAATVAVPCAAPSVALADEAADKAIQFRQRVMGAVAASAGGLAAAVQGDEASKAIIAELGALLAASADADLTLAAFAVNTTGASEVRTTALAKVWDEPADFQAGLRTMSDRAQAIAAKGADVTMEDLGGLFETCKTCHEAYRQR